jgi:hypothetical protein
MKDSTSTQPDGFPELVQFKSCNARIYRQRHRKVYRYEVRYHDADGLPQRNTFGSYEEAKDSATAIAKQLSIGGLDMTMLRGKERFVYENALDLLRPTGLSLDAAVAQLAESVKIVDGVASLREATELTKRHRPEGCPGSASGRPLTNRDARLKDFAAVPTPGSCSRMRMEAPWMNL